MNEQDQVRKGEEESSQLKGDIPSRPPDEEVYVYRDSGIQERHGTIPLWLKLVAIGLILWAVYYTVRYWGPTSSS